MAMPDGPYRYKHVADVLPSIATACGDFKFVLHNAETKRVIALVCDEFDAQAIAGMYNHACQRAKVNLTRRVQGKRP